MNPYELAVSVVGRTLEGLDDDKLIPFYGFGDCAQRESTPGASAFSCGIMCALHFLSTEGSNSRQRTPIKPERIPHTLIRTLCLSPATTTDKRCFSFFPGDQPARGFEEGLRRYRQIIPHVLLAGASPPFPHAAATVAPLPAPSAQRVLTENHAHRATSQARPPSDPSSAKPSAWSGRTAADTTSCSSLPTARRAHRPLPAARQATSLLTTVACLLMRLRRVSLGRVPAWAHLREPRRSALRPSFDRANAPSCAQVTRSVDAPSSIPSPQERDTIEAIVLASYCALSIVMVGVGDGPFDQMREFDDALHKAGRQFDNFQVNPKYQNAKGCPINFVILKLPDSPPLFCQPDDVL